MMRDDTPDLARLEANAARWGKFLREIEDRMLKLHQIEDMGGKIYDDSSGRNVLPEKLEELDAKWRNAFERWSSAADSLYEAYVRQQP